MWGNGNLMAPATCVNHRRLNRLIALRMGLFPGISSIEASLRIRAAAVFLQTAMRLLIAPAVRWPASCNWMTARVLRGASR